MLADALVAILYIIGGLSVVHHYAEASKLLTAFGGFAAFMGIASLIHVIRALRRRN